MQRDCPDEAGLLRARTGAYAVRLSYERGTFGGPRETSGEEKVDEQRGSAQNSRREIGELDQRRSGHRIEDLSGGAHPVAKHGSMRGLMMMGVVRFV